MEVRNRVMVMVRVRFRASRPHLVGLLVHETLEMPLDRLARLALGREVVAHIRERRLDLGVERLDRL